MEGQAILKRIAMLLFIAAASGAQANDAALRARVAAVLAATPLIDGHNDLPWELRDRYGADLSRIDLAQDTAHLAAPRPASAAFDPVLNAYPPVPPLMSDIPRMRAGGMGGQFWSVWIPASVTGPRAVEMTLEQIDLVKAMTSRWRGDFAMAYSAADVRRIHAEKRIACLIGIEGGHQIDASLPVIREMYAAGARYMTLTHFSNTPWADSATDVPAHHGLTAFGRLIVREMNRVGMLVDLAHVSADTMRAAIAESRAPVMFSHSSAYALDPSPRNVPDDVLRGVARNGGVVMVNFFPGYVSTAVRDWDAADAGEQAREKALHPGDPAAAAAGLRAWRGAHPAPRATLAQVADHIDYVHRVAGADHVGLGSDFDGIPDAPDGLGGTDKYPDLLVELARRGWSDADLASLAGGNVVRVLQAAEDTARRLQAVEQPSFATEAEVDR